MGRVTEKKISVTKSIFIIQEEDGTLAELLHNILLKDNHVMSRYNIPHPSSNHIEFTIDSSIHAPRDVFLTAIHNAMKLNQNHREQFQQACK